MTMGFNITQHRSFYPPKWYHLYFYCHYLFICLFVYLFIFYVNSFKCPVKIKKDSPKVISESPLWVPELMFLDVLCGGSAKEVKPFCKRHVFCLTSEGFLQSRTRETGGELWPLWSSLKVMNLHFTFKCQIHLCTLVWDWPASPFHLKYRASPEQYTSSFRVFAKHVTARTLCSVLY